MPCPVCPSLSRTDRKSEPHGRPVLDKLGQTGAVLAVVLLSACATTPTTPASVLSGLTPGAYVSGRPVALTNPLVFNAEDFVYDAKLSPDGRTAALSRLGMKAFHLALHDVANPPLRRADPAINALEFDVDTLEFSPDGAHVATVSRDGALRIYAASTGVLEAAWLTEEPLVSVAWNPTGDLLALGSARGLITLVGYPQLQHLAELRGHIDEVRAVAFTPAGELVTASWDKRLLVFTVADALTTPSEVRTHVEKKNGQVLFRAVLDRAANATVALDARAPMLVVKSPLAQAAGIEALTLTETTQIPNQFGNQVAKVARKRTLSIKNLTFDDVDVAICDACVPPDAQAVLGGPLLQRLSVAFDDGAKEIVFTVTGPVAMSSPKTLALARAFTMPAPVNDLSLDAKGRTAGVAMSETKSERTKQVYDREKKREVEPEREWDCGARVDVASGKVLEKVSGHRGVVATAGISPDGMTLATGGWDRKVIVHGEKKLIEPGFGWAVRRVRFSRDATKVIAAAWTPQNPLGDHQSDPSGVVFDVVYREGKVER